MTNENEKKPYITYGLAALNVLVFFVLELKGDTVGDAEFMVRMGAVWPEYISERGEYWRFLTAAFMHFGFGHLLSNMVLLVCAGPILERALGPLKYLLLYLSAGIGGNALSCMRRLINGHYAVSAGASGAIFGIIGALLWIVIRNKGRYKTLNSGGLVFLIAVNLIYGFTTGGVDNGGHIGGLAVGFLLGMMLYTEKIENS